MPEPTRPDEDVTPVGDEDIELIFDDDEETPVSAAAGEEVPDAAAREAVATARAELAQMRELYLRKLAEFDNFRKRTERERIELQRTAGEFVVRELLPVLDNFERALTHAGENDGSGFHAGVEMIFRQLKDILEKQGLAAIDPSGEPFQPELHEAVHVVESDQHPPGTVVSVLGKGYLFGGKLIRPAMVVVSVEPSLPSANETAQV